MTWKQVVVGWGLAMCYVPIAHGATRLKSQTIDMTCVTSSYPTTSFIIQTKGDRVQARVIHHNGLKYMPIHSGIVTPNDIKMLAGASADLAKLGTDYVMTWNASNCKVEGEKRFSCFDGDDTNIAGAKVSPWAIYTSRSVHDTIAGRYENVTMSLSLKIDGVDRSFAMDYDLSECN